MTDFVPPVAIDEQQFNAPVPTLQQNNLGAIAAVSNETHASALAAQTEAEVKARYAMALSRPRNFMAVRERMLADAQRPNFAATAIYHKPVGKGVEGPSIRFVESAIRAMGNILVATPSIYDDESKRIVRVSVTDLESNTYYSQDVTIVKTVERSSVKQGEKVLSQRLNSYGKLTYTVPATDDDILNKANALISKAVRTLGLRLIPGDLVDEALWMVRQTMSREDATDPKASLRRLVDAFHSVGVTADELTAYVGHNLEAVMTPAEISDLRNIYTAIKDGETTWKAVVEARREKMIAEAKEAADTEKKKAATAKADTTATKEAAEKKS